MPPASRPRPPPGRAPTATRAFPACAGISSPAARRPSCRLSAHAERAADRPHDHPFTGSSLDRSLLCPRSTGAATGSASKPPTTGPGNLDGLRSACLHAQTLRRTGSSPSARGHRVTLRGKGHIPQFVHHNERLHRTGDNAAVVAQRGLAPGGELPALLGVEEAELVEH